MNTETFIYLLANPQKITAEDVARLDTVIKKYPYFQSARALQLKGLKNEDSFLYNDALKLTAAHSTDRDVLFEYITSERFVQHEISQLILQHDSSVEEIKVVSEDISEQIKIEVADQLTAERRKAEAILNPDLFQRKVQSVTDLVEGKEVLKVEKKIDSDEIIQPDKPLEFKKNDTHSFSEWLKLTSAKPIQRPEEQKTEEIADEKERKFELIDKFIQGKPKIIPSQDVEVRTEASKDKIQKEAEKNHLSTSGQPTDSLMTETLAKVYLQQKNYKKAIQAYKILILKNPEKSGFFADQIRAIEKLINTQ